MSRIQSTTAKVSAFCHYASSPGLAAPPDRGALSDKPPTAQWHHPRSGGQRSYRRPLVLAAAVLTRIGPAELGADGPSIGSWRRRRIKKSGYLSCLRLSKWPGALRFRPLRREQPFDNGPQHQGQKAWPCIPEQLTRATNPGFVGRS